MATSMGRVSNHMRKTFFGSAAPVTCAEEQIMEMTEYEKP
jgi:hypothetical protein